MPCSCRCSSTRYANARAPTDAAGNVTRSSLNGTAFGFTSIPAPFANSGTGIFGLRADGRYGAVAGANGHGTIHGASAEYSLRSRTSNLRNTILSANTSTSTAP